MTTLAEHQHTTARWATAWTQLLETRVPSSLLAEGHALLRDHAAGALQVNPGFIYTTFPTGTGELRPRIDVPVLTDAQWDQIYESIASQPDIVPSAGTQAVTDLLTDPHYTSGIPILPAAEDLAFTCSCQTAAEPCVHTAALGLMTANRARTVPIAMFVLRGRAHQHLKKYLRRRAGRTNTKAEPPAQPAPSLPVFLAAMPAQEARYRAVYLPHTPALTGADTTPVLANVKDEPPAPSPSLTALNGLIIDAADRAAALLNGTLDSDPDLTSDLARFTASEHGESYTEQAAQCLELSYVQMRQLTAAHRAGGPAAVHTYMHITDTSPDVLAQAEAAIQDLRPSPFATLAREGNRLTDPAAHIQLRYGPDDRWHPYIERFGDWRVVPRPDANPATAYKAARSALRGR
ncbi:hypothetical protein [Streptomyces nigrescens]|uniref:hypothetical protein n=1 Tax=Streptomyces nigrescens TaxID=1920 RepID=UPI0036F7EA33